MGPEGNGNGVGVDEGDEGSVGVMAGETGTVDVAKVATGVDVFWTVVGRCDVAIW